jgi:hypothetical protein
MGGGFGSLPPAACTKGLWLGEQLRGCTVAKGGEANGRSRGSLKFKLLLSQNLIYSLAEKGILLMAPYLNVDQALRAP